MTSGSFVIRLCWTKAGLISRSTIRAYSSRIGRLGFVGQFGPCSFKQRDEFRVRAHADLFTATRFNVRNRALGQVAVCGYSRL
jgi:hypothetical protein